MLHHTILTVALTVAQAITFVDVMPGFQIEVAQATELGLTGCVWKDSLPIFVQGRIVEALAR